MRKLGRAVSTLCHMAHRGLRCDHILPSKAEESGPTLYGVQIRTQRIELTKRHPLTISRGTIKGSTNLVVIVEHEDVIGLGEMAPSDVTGDSAESAEAAITTWADDLSQLSPSEFDRIGEVVRSTNGSAVRCALDMACHDWLGRKLGVPVWSLLGIDRSRTPATSLTIGIDTISVLETKVPEILHRTQPKILKVKLGQAAGIDVDKEMFAAVQSIVDTVRAPITWRVDANGGWSLDDALRMIPWLGERGVDMIEQPLAQGNEEALGALSGLSVPIFADESIRMSHDVARFAHLVDGVNLKLMKCGGLREAIRIIHTARAHGLQVMIGCMGESSLAISAGAQLGGMVDALDLDSHLNLVDDPFEGAPYSDGRVLANDQPGLGVSWRQP